MKTRPKKELIILYLFLSPNWPGIYYISSSWLFMKSLKQNMCNAFKIFFFVWGTLYRSDYDHTNYNNVIIFWERVLEQLWHLPYTICICEWLLVAVKKSKELKVLFLNTNPILEDMPKKQIQSKFEQTGFFEQHKSYLYIWNIWVLHNACSHSVRFSLSP